MLLFLSLCVSIHHSGITTEQIKHILVGRDKHESFLQKLQETIILPDMKMKKEKNDVKMKNKWSNHISCGVHWCDVLSHLERGGRQGKE